jgi:diamine N-acetyltransferase
MKLNKLTFQNLISVIKLDANNGQNLITENYITILQAFFCDKLENIKTIYLNNTLIGIIWCCNKPNDKLYIRRFMIDKKYQNKGYGKLAFELSLNYFLKKYNKTKGIKCVRLSSRNKIAINMYKKFGFIETGETKRKDIFLELEI